MMRLIRRALLLALVVGTVTSLLMGQAGSNTVPGTRVEVDRRSIGLNDVKPPECIDVNVTNLVVGSGIFNGTSGNDLVIGGAGTDTINGQAGDDCILGGGGADSLSGGPGFDVCIGGPGIDIFPPLGGCEVQIQ